LPRLSEVMSGRLCSSLANCSLPLRLLISTGTISASNLPSACALPKRCCERSAQASWSSRLIWYSVARSSVCQPACSPEKGVVQPVVEHGVKDLLMAHAVAPAAAGHEIRGLVHVLHAAGEAHPGETELDLLGRRDDGLGTRAANAVDRHRWHLDGDPAADCRLTGRVHLVAGLDDVAHDDRPEFGRVELRAFQDCPDRGGPELGRGRALQAAAIGADGGADGMAEDDFGAGHGRIFPSGLRFHLADQDERTFALNQGRRWNRQTAASPSRPPLR
jgi:hypothetical protein